MRERVLGVETEYAVVYFPARGEERGPTNLSLYPLFESRLRERLESVPRAASLLRAKPGRFLANGMSFHYEATPHAFDQGLLEIASPECRDPFTLLEHEIAKDQLAEELREAVNRDLRAQGWRGEVRLLKNNVDAHGHTFGSHESYWIDDPLAPGRRLAVAPLWLLTWLATAPVLAWLLLASLVVALLPLLLLLLPVAALMLHGGARLVRRLHPAWAAACRRVALRLERTPARLALRLQSDPAAWMRRLSWIEWPLQLCIPLHAAVYGRFFFQPVLRDATGFLATRSVFSGAGSLAWDEGALLRTSQRAPFLRVVSAIFTHGDRRPMIELRDLFFRPWSAFGRRRRLHLMLGDANLCDWAFVLRMGATALVLEAIEAAPGDPEWPRLCDPLAAQRTASLDPFAPLPLWAGGTANAIELQQRVLQQVRRILGDTPCAWKRRVIRMWEETLVALRETPDALADRLDWVAKADLLRREVPSVEDRERLVREAPRLLRAAGPADAEEARLRELAFRLLRTDLRYHELGPRGGHRKLRQRDAIRSLADPEQVARARREPPTDTRARARGHAILDAARLGSGAATWHRVRVGRFGWRWFLDPLRP